LECETNSLNENLHKRKILKNLKPELVETSDPPIITKIKKIKLLLLKSLKEKPIFEILVIKENNVIEKLLCWLKNIKKIANRKMKYNNK
tara:strand:+ start:349 stop:615 length:267 start_codon:yes stop_codon:yes gene_type:complete